MLDRICRLELRNLLHSSVFPLASPLPSTTSLASSPASFGGFAGTTGSWLLPVTVHHRCTSWDFPMRSVNHSSTDSHGISRFPLKVLACMHRVLDRARSKSVSRYRRSQSCLPLSSTTSAPRSSPPLARWWFNCAAQWLACTYPCQRFTLALAAQGT